jgi:hypothetical protein
LATTMNGTWISRGSLFNSCFEQLLEPIATSFSQAPARLLFAIKGGMA